MSVVADRWRAISPCWFQGGLLVSVGLVFGGAVARAQPELDPAAQRLDGLAALVGGLTPGPNVIVILRSDVELRARLALSREGASPALGPVPAGLLEASQQELIGEALIAVEAARLSLSAPSALALAAERTRLLGTGASEAAAEALFRALDVDEREVSGWVARRAVVNGFLQANLEGTIDIAPSELARLFASEPHPFHNLPFDVARERFAAWLTQRRTREAVSRWVQSLAERTPHRVFAGYGASSETSGVSARR